MFIIHINEEQEGVDVNGACSALLRSVSFEKQRPFKKMTWMARVVRETVPF